MEIEINKEPKKRAKQSDAKQLNLISQPFSLAKDLDLRQLFREIRNYLAGTAQGMTRDESLLIEVIKVLFCKIYSERHPKKADRLFRHSQDEPNKVTFERIKLLFSKVIENYPKVFDEYDKFKLDPSSTTYLVEKLQHVEVLNSSRDPIGDAFEIFINSSLRGAEGQFFTPRNAINLIVGMCNPKSSDRILDPACGSASFLVSALKYIEDVSVGKKMSLSIYGVDKDAFLAFVGRAHLSLLLDREAEIASQNSLLQFEKYQLNGPAWFKENSFDVILTNPPYGADIVVGDDNLKSQFELAFKWSFNKKTSNWERTSSLQKNPGPQVIFLERCLRLLKPGGKCGVVLPESMFCNPSYSFVTSFLLQNTKIVSVVSFPESLFKTSGKTGTHTKTMGIVFEKIESGKPVPKEHEIFFAEARWCGHDSRGLQIPHDDFPTILSNFVAFNKTEKRSVRRDHLGFSVKQSDIRNNILIPKYYDPELAQDINKLSVSHDLVRFGDLVQSGTLELCTGDEVGKLAYGTGNIPFVRTSDISNWEIKIDSKQGISQEHFSRLAKRQDVRPLDLLMVRDGTYLIGTTAIVTKTDLPLLYQSHLFKIRSADHKKMSPFLLLAILSSSIVQRQIQSFRFTQDIIDTLGNRVNDLILPVPKDLGLQNKVIKDVGEAISARCLAREAARLARMEVIGEVYTPNYQTI